MDNTKKWRILTRENEQCQGKRGRVQGIFFYGLSRNSFKRYDLSPDHVTIAPRKCQEGYYDKHRRNRRLLLSGIIAKRNIGREKVGSKGGSNVLTGGVFCLFGYGMPVFFFQIFLKLKSGG